MLNQKRIAALALSALLLLTTSANAAAEGWTEDFEAAKAQAKAEGKDLLIDFTGSDWCGWCVRLTKEVFSQEDFKSYADERFVLVKLDYPSKKPQSDEIKAQNEKLKAAFGIQGFPTIILADADGKGYAKTGYKAGGPKAYNKHLEEMAAYKQKRDEFLRLADEVNGLHRALLINEVLETVGEQLAITQYQDLITELIAIDENNEKGYRQKYRVLMADHANKQALNETMTRFEKDPTAAIEAINTMLANEVLSNELRQSALISKYRLQMKLKMTSEAILTLQQAVAADPESNTGKSLINAIISLEAKQREEKKQS
jgi:uncharacterized protein YyaL (SSP411 family)